MSRTTIQSFFLLSLLIPLIALSGCTSGKRTDDGPLTPMPDGFTAVDPDDHILDLAVKRYLAQANGPVSSRYEFTRVDLDGDKRRDALVMMVGPHHYWCAMDGCSLVVLKASDADFSVVSEIYPVRGPMYVSEKVTDEGWKNLIIRVSGQSYAKAKDVAMKFDGETYPRNPFFEPAITLSQADHGQRLFP